MRKYVVMLLVVVMFMAVPVFAQGLDPECGTACEDGSGGGWTQTCKRCIPYPSNPDRVACEMMFSQGPWQTHHTGRFECTPYNAEIGPNACVMGGLYCGGYESGNYYSAALRDAPKRSPSPSPLPPLLYNDMAADLDWFIAQQVPRYVSTSELLDLRNRAGDAATARGMYEIYRQEVNRRWPDRFSLKDGDTIALPGRARRASVATVAVAPQENEKERGAR